MVKASGDKTNSHEGIFLRAVKRFALFVVKADVKAAKYRYGLNRVERKERIILSMTSYPKRFNSIILPLKSLLMQSVKADKIIVWFGNDASPEMLTDEMRNLQQYGVEYRFDKTKNLKPHKKYFYALQEFKNDLVITVDDDIIYPRNMVKSLIKTHRKFPDAVCARRVHKIEFGSDGEPLPYNSWKWEYRHSKLPQNDLLPTNGAGSLFPPNSLDTRAFNADDIMENCLNADDVWLWCMERLKGTSVVWTPCLLVHPPVVEETRSAVSLASTNVEENGNDAYIKRMIQKYNILHKDM